MFIIIVRMSKALLLLLIINILLVSIIAPVDASYDAGYKSETTQITIYVDDDNVLGPWYGTLEHPYRTIVDGFDNASEGDTIFVFNGIYNESIDFTKSIKLIGEDKYNTIIESYWSSFEIESINGLEIRNFMFRYTQPMFLFHSSYCTISGNIFLGSSYAEAIWLSNCSNCILSDNNIQVGGKSTCIILSSSSNNEVRNNYFYSSNKDSIGIDIERGSDGSVVTNNTIQNFTVGIDVSTSNEASIIDNNIFNSTNHGIRFFGSSNSTVSRNKIINNYYGMDISYSDDVLISDNIVTDNRVYGISLTYGKNIGAIRNVLYNNPYGIEFNYIENSFCTYNIISNSSESGINMWTYATNTLISNNNVNNCYYGVTLNESSKNTIQENMVSFNEFGIMLYGKESSNVIKKNEVRNNGYGIVLYGFIKSGIKSAPFKNFLVGNNICGNTNYGVYSTVFVLLNHIYQNNFIGNEKNAFDKGTNIWYKFKLFGKSGNYWDDYADDGKGYKIPPLLIRNRDRFPSKAPIDIENLY